MQQFFEPWNIAGIEFMKGTFHYEKSQPYKLWYEYLRLSPTYFLAHKHRTSYDGGLTENEKKTLPDDFDDVLKTYDAFGDVYKYHFRMWWAVKSKSHLFGEPSAKLVATPIAYVPENHETNREACKIELDKYLDFTHPFIGRPSYMLITVPLNGTRANILKAVSEKIDDDYLQPLTATYKLHGERFQYDTLSTGLRLLYEKARKPELALWRLGVRAYISEKYLFLDTEATKIPHQMVEEIQILKNTTSRMLNNSIYIMENAARGKFPCKDKIAKPKINYHYMWQCIRSRYKENRQQALDMLKLIEDGLDMNLYEDWQETMLDLVPDYKTMRDEQKLNHKKKFLNEQLAMHKPRKSIIILPSRERYK
jgi:hypothetical protein